MPPADTTPDPPRFRRYSAEDAEERGHRRGWCPKCGRVVWSEDSGYFECLSCGPEPIEHREEDEDE